MEVREVREARPVTIETISSSWVMALCGNGGMLVLTGVKAIGRGTCMDNTANNLKAHGPVQINPALVFLSWFYSGHVQQ